MKRDFLKELGLEEDAINRIMAENGKDIEKAKGDSDKLSAELDQVKSELDKANQALEKVKDYDQTKAEFEKYKAETENSRAEYEKKLKTMESEASVKDFLSNYQSKNKRKFMNSYTENSIKKTLLEEMGKEENKNKNLDDLLSKITEGKDDVFKNESAPVPPNVPSMNGDKKAGDDEAKVRQVMGLPPLK